jgi:hypothetical protein
MGNNRKVLSKTTSNKLNFLLNKNRGFMGKGEEIILAIDPGNEQSAFVLFDKTQNTIIDKRILDNGLLLGYMQDVVFDHLAIEMIASYGMPVGKEIFETCVWIGRFIEFAKKPYTKIYRKDVKMYLCQNMKAKDGNIRQALIDLLGKEVTKGCSKDIWAALAVAVTYCNTQIVVNYGEIPF